MGTNEIQTIGVSFNPKFQGGGATISPAPPKKRKKQEQLKLLSYKQRDLKYKRDTNDWPFF